MAKDRKKFVIRDGDGEYVASYANLSEANTYILASFPSCRVEKVPESDPRFEQIVNDEGTVVGYLDHPKE